MISILLRSIPFFFTVMSLSALSLLEAKGFVSPNVSTEETLSFLFQGFMYAIAMFFILWGGTGVLILVNRFLKKI